MAYYYRKGYVYQPKQHSGDKARSSYKRRSHSSSNFTSGYSLRSMVYRIEKFLISGGKKVCVTSRVERDEDGERDVFSVEFVS